MSAISISDTVLEAVDSNVTQEEMEDIANCLLTLYTTPVGSQEGARDFGLDTEKCMDKPLEAAESLLTAEIVEKTATYEPRVQVEQVEWMESDFQNGELIPKVVYKIVENNRT